MHTETVGLKLEAKERSLQKATVESERSRARNGGAIKTLNQFRLILREKIHPNILNQEYIDIGGISIGKGRRKCAHDVFSHSLKQTITYRV